MTALGKAQQKYKITFLLESIVFILSVIFLYFLQKSFAVSFAAGFFSAFFPYVLFVGVFFFVKNRQKLNLKRFYIGEACKLFFTAILVVIFFITIKLNVILFFSGYFLAILTNNLLPFFIENFNRR